MLFNSKSDWRCPRRFRNVTSPEMVCPSLFRSVPFDSRCAVVRTLGSPVAVGAMHAMCFVVSIRVPVQKDRACMPRSLALWSIRAKTTTAVQRPDAHRCEEPVTTRRGRKNIVLRTDEVELGTSNLTLVCPLQRPLLMSTPSQQWVRP